MKNLLVLTTLSAMLISCGSSEKKPREFKLEYEVVNASNKIEPDWIEDVEKYKGNKDYRYFVSESENSVKRLCKKSATARASAVIASEVVQEVKNDYVEVTRKDENAEVEKYFSDTLKHQIETKVSGVRVIKEYWEKRKFKTDDEDKFLYKYACFSLVAMKESLMEKNIKMAQKRTLSNLGEKSIKDELKKKFEE